MIEFIFFLVGLITMYLITKVLSNREHTRRRAKQLSNLKYITSIKDEYAEFIELIYFYILDNNPTEVLRKEIKKTIKREAIKWGVILDDASDSGSYRGSDDSDSTYSTDREGKPNN